MTELWQHTATEMTKLLRSGEASAQELTEAALSRLQAVNPAINAVVMQMPEQALASAREVDAKIARGEQLGALAGVPVTIKVNADQAGFASTNGLRLLKDNVVDIDNPVVANIKKADAVIIGRTNTPAFSMRWFTRNSIHGHTLNPHNAAITPGGSSGGAAAAVAAGIGAIGQGSDIAGSIRYPAYACGIHGIRPSLGRVPNANLSASDRHLGAQITAVAGPLARSIADLRISLEAMAARDVRDPWWTPAPLDGGDFDKTVALCFKPEGLDCDDAVCDALQDAADKLGEAGWTVEQVDCPPLREPCELQILLWMSELQRNGTQIIFDEADPDAQFVFTEFQKRWPAADLNGFMDLLQSRATLTRQWLEFLETHSTVLLPISSKLPFDDNVDVKSAQDFDDVIEAQLTQIALPLLGIPAIAVATGSFDNRPIGVQLVASRYREDILLEAAEAIEQRGAPLQVVTPVDA